MKQTLHVLIERDVDGGFVASVIELPGCHSQGDSLEEVRANIREAIDLYLEGENLPADLPAFVAVEKVEVSGLRHFDPSLPASCSVRCLATDFARSQRRLLIGSSEIPRAGMMVPIHRARRFVLVSSPESLTRLESTRWCS